ncbi:MAG: 30S ribosomal protein S16 [Parcubacteria group bacterium]|nr:MAG: 30S ribosomal protein S16 [Parcubacteria group bacterium]
MLRIGLARIGRTKKPLYRLVVSEKTKDMYGDNLEVLGNYDPHSKKATFKAERIKYWIGQGAQTTTVVHNILVKEKIITGVKKRAVTISKKRMAKQTAAKQVAAKAQAPVDSPALETVAEPSAPTA